MREEVVLNLRRACVMDGSLLEETNGVFSLACDRGQLRVVLVLQFPDVALTLLYLLLQLGILLENALITALPVLLLLLMRLKSSFVCLA